MKNGLHCTEHREIYLPDEADTEWRMLVKAIELISDSGAHMLNIRGVLRFVRVTRTRSALVFSFYHTRMKTRFVLCVCVFDSLL